MAVGVDRISEIVRHYLEHGEQATIDTFDVNADGMPK